MPKEITKKQFTRVLDQFLFLRSNEYLTGLDMKISSSSSSSQKIGNTLKESSSKEALQMSACEMQDKLIETAFEFLNPVASQPMSFAPNEETMNRPPHVMQCNVRRFIMVLLNVNSTASTSE